MSADQLNQPDISFEVVQCHIAFMLPYKYTKNLRKNGRMRAKYDKWLVHIPFLCYPSIFLISAEIAVYGGS